MKVEWKDIEKVPEDWLDGRRLLVFDVVTMAPVVMSKVEEGWSRKGEFADYCEITHYACDADVCPENLVPELIDDFMALQSGAARKWAIAITYAKSKTPIDGEHGLKHRPAVLYRAMLKLAGDSSEIKVYRKRVAEAWEAVYKMPHTHMKVASDLRKIVEAGLAVKIESGFDWREMVPSTYKLTPTAEIT